MHSGLISSLRVQKDLAYLEGLGTSQTSPQLMNLQTQKLIPLPSMKSTFFTQVSLALVGAQIFTDGTQQAVSVSTLDGKVTPLCPRVTAKVTQIQEISANRFLILTYDQASQILKVYLQNQSCQLVNSIPLGNANTNSIRDIIVSPDGKKIIAKTGVTKDPSVGTFSALGLIEREESSQLLYIPLDGHPAFVISSPVYEGAAIYEPYFASDSQTVIYLGDQIRPGDSNVFLWTAPLSN